MYKKIICHEIGTDFRKCTHIEPAFTSTLSVQLTQLKDFVIVRVSHVGINASDINYINGKYTKVKPPFDTGFEGIGIVWQVGEQVTSFKKGDPVIFSAFGAFSEFILLHEKQLIPLPFLSPSFLPLLVSGLTASIALERVGEIKEGQTVLVTAAAGATGLFAVQLAVLKGCRVIAACSNMEKAQLLQSLGCERVINYRQEDLNQVLKNEYPKGIDCVYESVGGAVFETCLNNLAHHGKLIVIGFVSGYKNGSGWSRAYQQSTDQLAIPAKLLQKSASIRGFFLNDFASDWPKHFKMLSTLLVEKKIQSFVDDGSARTGKKFVGLESVAEALDYLYESRNIGKIVVELFDETEKQEEVTKVSATAARSKL